MSKAKTIIDIYNKTQALNKEIPQIPCDVWRTVFGKKSYITICDDQISLGNETDFCSMEELRDSLQWLVNQLGGKVKWDS